MRTERRAKLAFAVAAVVTAIAGVARGDGSSPPPAPAPSLDPSFRTAGGSIFCAIIDVNHTWTGFTCFRPRDGHYVRFEAADMTGDVRPTVTSGVDPRFVGASDPAYDVLHTGRAWYSSDAALVSCRVRRDGVRCRHWLGPTFFIGNESGERTSP